MSVKAYFWAREIGRELNIKSSSRFVLRELADCHNQSTHQCNPSVSHISDYSGLDRKTVIKAIDDLQKIGVLTVEKRRGARNNFHLNFDLIPLDTSTKNGITSEKSSTNNGTGSSIETSTKSGTTSAETSTKSGTSTKFGTSTKSGTTPVPKTVLPPVPNLGHEPISNLKEPITNNRTKKTASRKKAINRDFSLPDDWRNLAINYWSEKNRIDLNPDDEFFKFKNYHLANGSKFVCWKSAWKNWYVNSVNFNKPFQSNQNQIRPQIRMLKPAGSEQ